MINSTFKIVFPKQKLQDNYEIGLVITTYNRPWYLLRTMISLSQSDLKNTIILMIDDGSSNKWTKRLFEKFNLKNTPIIKAFQKEKKGCMMFENLKFGWDFLQTKFNCKYLTNLDPDAIVKSNWLSQLKKTHQIGVEKNKEILVTGFNAFQHPILKEEKNYYQKKSIGGINFFFNQSFYKKNIEPALIDLQWDDHVVKFCEENNHPILCTKPSVVQHIGRAGLWSGIRSGTYDFAIDYGSVNPRVMKLKLFYFQKSKKWSKDFLLAFHFWKKRFATKMQTFFFGNKT